MRALQLQRGCLRRCAAIVSCQVAPSTRLCAIACTTRACPATRPQWSAASAAVTPLNVCNGQLAHVCTELHGLQAQPHDGAVEVRREQFQQAGVSTTAAPGLAARYCGTGERRHGPAAAVRACRAARAAATRLCRGAILYDRDLELCVADVSHNHQFRADLRRTGRSRRLVPPPHSATARDAATASGVRVKIARLGTGRAPW